MNTKLRNNYERPQAESFPVAVEECILSDWKQPIEDDGELE